MNSNNPLSAPPPQPQHDSFCACFGGRNILICKKSWREFEELPLPEQQQVWSDLSAGAGIGGSGARPSRGAPPRTTASSFTVQTAEPFPASIMASLHSLPAGGEAAVVERSVENLREELYRIQLNHQHRTTNGSNNNGNNDKGNDPKASPDSMDALMLALSRSPAYVTDQKLLLKFLRSEHFDVPAAAKRMGRHFHEKRLLFPLEALTRDIRYADLSANDMDSLDRGFLQVLRKRDHIGRPVMFYYKALSNCYIERENILRTYFYMTHALSDDVDVQKRGVVHVVYNHAYPKGGMDFEKSRRLARLFRAVPIRFPTFWVCLIGSNNDPKARTSTRHMRPAGAYPASITDDEGNDDDDEDKENDIKPWWTVVDTFSVLIEKMLSVRLRVLVGSRQECMYQLLELGIPQHSIPTNDQNRLKLNYHRRWIQEQRRVEQEEEMARQRERQRQEQLESEQQQAPMAHLLQPDTLNSLFQATAAHYGNFSAAVG